MKPLDQSKMTSFGRKGTFGFVKRSRFLNKVLPIATLMFFVYNSFDTSSMDIYRQLQEASEKTPTEESGKVDGKYKYCRTPYVLKEHLMSTVPKVIPPKDRMDPPSHIQLCKAFLDRTDLSADEAEAAPIIKVKEDPAVCVDWSAPHYSTMTILASSLIASVGYKFGLRYSHDCHKFIAFTREGEYTHYDYTTVQEVLPENLISSKDAESVDVDLVKDLCNSCISELDTTNPSSFDASTHHCFLFPGESTAEIIMEKNQELPLTSVLSSTVDRMRHVSQDWIGATNAIKFEEDSGVIISLDKSSTFMDFSYYDSAISIPPTSIQIFASANCAFAFLNNQSDCIEHGRALKAHFTKRFPAVYTRYDIVASTATSVSRMMHVKMLICPPGTVNCLLPGLAKLPGTKAIIAEDGTRPLTFHWYEKSLLKERKKLELNRQGVDTVNDEDFLLISEETGTEMPQGLPLEDLNFDEPDVAQIEFDENNTPRFHVPEDTPFNLPYDQLLGDDLRAPQVDSSSQHDDSEHKEIPNIFPEASFDEPKKELDKDHFNAILGNIANDMSGNSDAEERSSSSISTTEQTESPKPVEVESDSSQTETPQVEVPKEPEAVALEAELEKLERESAETDVSPPEPEVSEDVQPEQDVISETSVDIGRLYNSEENTTVVPQMSDVDVPQMSEVDVPEYITQDQGFQEDFGGRSNEMTTMERVPVYDFWNDGIKDHTFHLGEPLGGEEKGHIQYFVYPQQAPGTEPVFTFYNEENSEYTVHLGDPWEGEVKQDIAFYAYQYHVPGPDLVPVQVYWHETDKSHTFHYGDPWPGEVSKGVVAFYAFRFQA